MTPEHHLAGLLDAAPHRVVSGALAAANFVVIAIEALSEGREDRTRDRAPDDQAPEDRASDDPAP